MKSKEDNNNNEDTLMYKRSPRHDDKNNNHVINISNKKIFYDSDKLNISEWPIIMNDWLKLTTSVFHHKMNLFWQMLFVSPA